MKSMRFASLTFAGAIVIALWAGVPRDAAAYGSQHGYAHGQTKKKAVKKAPGQMKKATKTQPTQPVARPFRRPPAPNVRMVHVMAKNHRFYPSQFTVKPGQRVSIMLTNREEAPHSMAFEIPGGNVRFAHDLLSHEQQSLTFVAPSIPGTYVFYCPVGDHRQRGMTGTLIVR